MIRILNIGKRALSFAFAVILAAAFFPYGESAAETADVTVYAPEDTSFATERLVYNALKSAGVSCHIENRLSGIDSVEAAKGFNNSIVTGVSEQTISMYGTDFVKVDIPVGKQINFVYTRADTGLIVSSWNDLHGLKVGVSAYHKYARTKVADCVITADMQSNFEALKSGAVDVITDTVYDGVEAPLPEGIVTAGIVETSNTYCWYQSSQPEIGRQLRQGLETIQSNGVFDRIISHKSVNPNNPKVVFQISSYSTEMLWASQGEQGLRDTLADYREPISLYIYNLNFRRTNYRFAQYDAASEFIRATFMDEYPDVIVVADNDALMFLKENYARLFYGVPVVFCGVNFYEESMTEGFAQYVTGVCEYMDPTGSVEFALNVNPNINRIYAIFDETSSASIIKKGTMEVLNDKYGHKMDIIESGSKTFDEVLAEVKSFDKNTMLLIGTYFSDKEGRFMPESEVALKLNQAANSPVYCLMSSYLGYGVIGGHVSWSNVFNAEAGRIALSILDGKDVSQIPIVYDDESALLFNAMLVDKTVANKYSVGKERFPHGTVVINGGKSIFSEYPMQSAAALSVIMFLIAATVFTVFLMKMRHARSMAVLSAEKTGLLENIVDSIPNIVFCMSSDLKYTLVNKYFADYFNMSKSDIIGKSEGDFRLRPKFSEDTLESVGRRVIDEDQRVSYEEYALRFDGVEQLFETIKVPLKLDGKVIGLVGTAHDITEHKKLEKEIRAQKNLLSTIVDSIPGIVYCKNLEFNHTLSNRFAKDYFGMSGDKIGDKPVGSGWNMIGLSDKDAEFADGMERESVIGHKKVTHELWLPSASGEKRRFELTVLPLVQEGEVAGIVGIGYDITALKEMQEAAMAASRSKSSFLANMSHELRTPLNVIIGLTDLILEENHLAKHVTENMVKISGAGGTLLSIVNDILDISKIESGKLTLMPAEYYTASLLNDVTTLVTTRLSEKQVKFRLNISDKLPRKLYGDDLRVKQILNNLLSNAVKHTNTGTIDLTVECETDGGDVWMEITVSDTGVGIRKEDIQNLFTDYYQVESEANRRVAGTGLGLSITKRFTEMMSGEVSVESEYGKGTSFRVRIKQGYVSDDAIGGNTADSLRKFQYTDDEKKTAKKLERVDLRNARVLVVDDMQTNLVVTTGLLRKYKMQVDCVTNGQEAVERIRYGNPYYNAVFMDHMMPEMDGLETTDAIRAINTDYARQIPIIALTANAVSGVMNIFYEHNFQDFVSKPIDIMHLDRVVRKWIKNIKLGEESADSPASEAPAFDIPGLNTEKGLALFGGDRELYLTILRSFIANTPDVLNKIRNVTADTLNDYAVGVHGLKSISASICAELIEKNAIRLEESAKLGDWEYVLLENEGFINDVENLLASVKTWLEL